MEPSLSTLQQNGGPDNESVSPSLSNAARLAELKNDLGSIADRFKPLWMQQFSLPDLILEPTITTDSREEGNVSLPRVSPSTPAKMPGGTPAGTPAVMLARSRRESLEAAAEYANDIFEDEDSSRESGAGAASALVHQVSHHALALGDADAEDSPIHPAAPHPAPSSRASPAASSEPDAAPSPARAQDFTLLITTGAPRVVGVGDDQADPGTDHATEALFEPMVQVVAQEHVSKEGVAPEQALVWRLEIPEDSHSSAGEAVSPSKSPADATQDAPACALPQLELGRVDPAVAVSSVHDASVTPIAKPETLGIDWPSGETPQNADSGGDKAVGPVEESSPPQEPLATSPQTGSRDEIAHEGAAYSSHAADDAKSHAAPDDAHALPARSASPAGSGHVASRQLAENASERGARSSVMTISADALRRASPRAVPYTDVMVEWDRRGSLTMEGDDASYAPAPEELEAGPHKGAGAASKPKKKHRTAARWSEHSQMLAEATFAAQASSKDPPRADATSASASALAHAAFCEHAGEEHLRDHPPRARAQHPRAQHHLRRRAAKSTHHSSAAASRSRRSSLQPSPRRSRRSSVDMEHASSAAQPVKGPNDNCHPAPSAGAATYGVSTLLAMARREDSHSLANGGGGMTRRASSARSDVCETMTQQIPRLSATEGAPGGIKKRVTGPTPSPQRSFRPSTTMPNMGSKLHQDYSSWSDYSGWFGLDSPCIEAAETAGPAEGFSNSTIAGAGLVCADRDEGAKQRNALQERILHMCESRNMRELEVCLAEASKVGMTVDNKYVEVGRTMLQLQARKKDVRKAHSAHQVPALIKIVDSVAAAGAGNTLKSKWYMKAADLVLQLELQQTVNRALLDGSQAVLAHAMKAVNDFNNVDITRIHSDRLGIAWRQAHGHKNVLQWEKQKREEGSERRRELKKLKKLDKQKKQIFDCREQYLRAAVYAPWKGLPKGPYPCVSAPNASHPKSSHNSSSTAAANETMQNRCAGDGHASDAESISSQSRQGSSKHLLRNSEQPQARLATSDVTAPRRQTSGNCGADSDISPSNNHSHRRSSFSPCPRSPRKRLLNAVGFPMTKSNRSAISKTESRCNIMQLRAINQMEFDRWLMTKAAEEEARNVLKSKQKRRVDIDPWVLEEQEKSARVHKLILENNWQA